MISALGNSLVFGAGSRNRTHDQRFTKPLLYQLSYAGTKGILPRRVGTTAVRGDVGNYLTTDRCDGRGFGLSPSPGSTATDSSGAVALASDATGSCVTVNANP